MAKIGLFFGSFNPIHIGHMAIAGYMKEFTDLDQIWFVISPLNPLKKRESLLADHYRLDLVELAIGDDDAMQPSDIEFRLPAPSYTIDTMMWLTERHPNNKFVLLMGEDNCILSISGKMPPNWLASFLYMFIPVPVLQRNQILFLMNCLLKRL
jgi:nicotinate-nucleotide adenylyltransferase